MTDEGDITKMANKNNEQETIESDNEQEESVCSNVTTDDEFYNELMSAPAEHEDHLIPDECKDEVTAIEHLTSCLNRRYNSCPVVFPGTLKGAIKEAFSSKEIKERLPLLIYINNDISVYSNIFCKQLLCHEKIIDYLLNNYVLWAWDVTFRSNGEKLNEMYKMAFSQWNTEHQIGAKSIEQYPLLIAVSHDKNGDYSFKYLINGSDKRPIVDEFLARLIEFKDQFEYSEEDYEKEKTKKYELNSLLRTHDFHHRSTAMNFDGNPSPYSRFLSHDNDQFFMNRRDYLPNTFRHLNINPDDGDDEDDDDKTPTVEYSSPRYPKK